MVKTYFKKSTKNSKRIAIIGAGAAGLTSAKSALSANLSVTLFESTHTIGGVWQPDGQAWPTMKVNISRYTGVFSDFKWPADMADFPTTKNMYQYLCAYAEHFQLMRHVKFNRHVEKVYQQNGAWIVCWKENQKIFQEAFDYVIIAVSRFQTPYIPPFKGLEHLKVRHIHSSQFRSPDHFKNLRTLVIGGSLSGTSIAEELADYTEVIHLFRKERWALQRYRPLNLNKPEVKLPRDLIKFYQSDDKNLTREEKYHFMIKLCHEQQSIPEWAMSFDSKEGFVVVEDYFKKVKSKKITCVRGEIELIAESKVKLMDGREIFFDAVIFCTGYQREIAFLSSELQQRIQSQTLYDDTFIPGVERCAILNMYPRARGAVFPLIELQAKLVCAVFTGKIMLPSHKIMMEEIAALMEPQDEMTFIQSLSKKLNIKPTAEKVKKDYEEKHKMTNLTINQNRLFKNEIRAQAFQSKSESKKKYTKIRSSL